MLLVYRTTYLAWSCPGILGGKAFKNKRISQGRRKRANKAPSAVGKTPSHRADRRFSTAPEPLQSRPRASPSPATQSPKKGAQCLLVYSGTLDCELKQSAGHPAASTVRMRAERSALLQRLLFWEAVGTAGRRPRPLPTAPPPHAPKNTRLLPAAKNAPGNRA